MARKASRVVKVKGLGEAKGRGPAPHIDEGEYNVRVEEIVQKESSAGNQMFEWTLKGLDGEAKGKTFYFHTNLEPPDTLWKLRNTMLALGVEVPEDLDEVDLDELEGLEGTVLIEDDEWQGKMRSKVSRFVDGEDVEEDKPKAKRKRAAAAEEDEEDDEPTPRKKKTAAKKPPSDDEIMDMAEDELEGLIEKHDLDVDLSAYKTLRRKATAVIAALQNE